MIGVGGFGKVFRGYFECKEVAIKEVKMPIGESLEVTSDRVQQEARLLWVLKHKNVISLIGVCLEVRKSPNRIIHVQDKKESILETSFLY